MKQQATITKSEFAQRHGWSAQYVSKLLREGKISQTVNGRINIAQAEAELAAHRGHTAHGPNGRSLCAGDDWDHAIVSAWNDFFTATERLWKIVPEKKLSKQVMLGMVRELK